MAKRTVESSARPPRFKTEAEEADWWVGTDGRKFSRVHSAGKKVVATGKSEIDKEIRAQLKSGLAVRFRNGLDIRQTDPAELQEIVDRVRAKQTKLISLRISVGDLEAAKRMAETAGIGYQTVLKEIISKGLRRA